MIKVGARVGLEITRVKPHMASWSRSLTAAFPLAEQSKEEPAPTRPHPSKLRRHRSPNALFRPHQIGIQAVQGQHLNFQRFQCRHMSSTSSKEDEIDVESPGSAEFAEMSDSWTEIMAGLPEPIKELTHTPPDLVLQALGWTHNMTELPWWMSIALCTVIVRVAVFPLTVNSIRATARLKEVQPQMKIIMAEMKEATAMEDTARLRKAQEDYRTLATKNGASPMKLLIAPLVQAPIFISFFWALRKMEEYYPSISSGGAFWFEDLTVADPTMILPVISLGSMLLTIELSGNAEMGDQAKMMKNVFRAMSFIFFPVIYQFPSGVFIYWVTSNSFSVGQTLLVQNNAARRILSLPPIKPPTPALETSAGESGSPFASALGVADKLTGQDKPAAPVEMAKSHSKKNGAQQSKRGQRKGKKRRGRSPFKDGK